LGLAKLAARVGIPTGQQDAAPAPFGTHTVQAVFAGGGTVSFIATQIVPVKTIAATAYRLIPNAPFSAQTELLHSR
jgi:hypothetical protein